MVLRITCLVITFTLCLTTEGVSQSDDIVTDIFWNSARLSIKLDKRHTFNIRPIVRHVENLEGYVNHSMDLTLKRKLENGWHIAMSTRTWFLKDGSMRQFIWPEFGHTFTIGSLKISNRLLKHWALDVDDRNDPDFLRLMTAISPIVDWKVKPFFKIEPFFRVNGNNRVERMRYEPGVNIVFNPQNTMTLMYWRQESFYRTPRTIEHIYHVVFTHNVSRA